MTSLTAHNSAAQDVPGAHAPEPGRPFACAWVIVAALWPVAMLNYLDQQMLATIRATIRADIPSIASDQDFGTLMAVFMWTYAVRVRSADLWRIGSIGAGQSLVAC